METTRRVAVIGAGPAGMRAARDQATAENTFVDLFERRPAPFGLIAYGTCPRLRLVGNVEVGRDVAVDELREYYDEVLDTTANEWDGASIRVFHDAGDVLSLLRSRRIPFTTWESSRIAAQEAAWEDIVMRAQAVPICDQ